MSRRKLRRGDVVLTRFPFENLIRRLGRISASIQAEVDSRLALALGLKKQKGTTP